MALFTAQTKGRRVSVEEAIREAVETPQKESPWPLRKSSTQRIAPEYAPQPIFTSPHQSVRGFRPPMAEPLPQINALTASSEHAFAARSQRRPSELPLGRLASEYEGSVAMFDWPSSRMSAASDTPTSQLSYQDKVISPVSSITQDSLSNALCSDRRSYLSEVTIEPESSDANIDSTSPNNDAVKVYPTSLLEDVVDGSDTNEDFIGLYEAGFDSAKQSMDTAGRRSFNFERTNMVFDATTRASLQFTRPASTQPYEASSLRVVGHHRRSQSASLLKRWVSSPARTYSPSKELTTEELKPEPTVQVEQVPRDRYGFKKTSQYISSAEYDAWDRVYSEHILRRTKKWHALMKAYGLNTEKPYRFPPKSDKITRYVRKGIPPDFRGAAWFWYGGGHSRLARNPNLYQRLLQDIQNGKLSDNDREHIERDLNRTFPDNIRFKPDMAAMPDTKPRGGGGKSSQSSETSIVQSLRRVLQAFAVHNPEIGYCQSLNFIAGLLLLFLDEDEKKAFTLLEIVTSEYLPGTHGIALEGANIDIAVLMSLIQETMTPIWNKLDDKSSGLAGDPTAQALRLPTVSLATTAWFMSLFVGTLPIEAVLRVWDCLFFEGSKTLFRVALAIFRAGQKQILAVHDSVEIFQVVQTIPRTMLDINTLMEVSFGGRRKGGFGGVSQKDIERRRESRRQDVQNGVGRLHAKDGSWKARLKGRGRA